MTRSARRIATLVAAPASALTAWAIVRFLGVELVVSSGDGTVGPVDVAVTALAGALGGWLVVRLLEHRAAHPRRLWALHRIDSPSRLDDRHVVATTARIDA